MNGWIKLHRQTIENDIWKYDPTAWRVFEALMFLVDYETGQWRGGRFRLADYCEMNSNTVRHAVERLVKAGMVATVGASKFTTYSICKWSEYQEVEATPKATTEASKRPAKGQQKATILRNKEAQEVKEKTTTTVVGAYGSPEINQVFQDWQEATGISLTSNVKRNRFAASNLLKKHGAENVGKLLKLVGAAQLDQYAPRIADFCQLQAKLPDLLVWAKREGVAQQKHQIVSV